MATKSRSLNHEEAPEGHGRFWQPVSERNVLSEPGKRWLEENAEAARAWSEWVEKNGVPLAQYRKF